VVMVQFTVMRVIVLQKCDFSWSVIIPCLTYLSILMWSNVAVI